MRKNDEINISAVDNGFVVKGENKGYGSEGFLAFSSKNDLIDYLQEHFDAPQDALSTIEESKKRR